jgi:hypothetical protein
MIADFTSKANARPGSAAVTVQVVVQDREPLRLRPLNTAPGAAEEPVVQDIASTSAPRVASVGRSVISAYTAAGSAATVTEDWMGAVMCEW